MWCVLQARRGMGFTEVFCLPPPSFLLPGAVAPHPRVCVVCVVLWRRWGFLRGVCLFFLMVFHGECGADLVNSVGLRGHLLGWGECAWAVC